MAQPIELLFPSGGLDKRAGYQKQRPFTTPDTVNCRPLVGSLVRERGGSRHGMSKAFAENLGGRTQMIATVDAVDDSRSFTDSFDKNLIGVTTYGAWWSAVSGSDIPTVVANSLHWNAGEDGTLLLNLDQSRIDETKSRTVKIDIPAVNGATFIVYLQADTFLNNFILAKIVLDANYTANKQSVTTVTQYIGGILSTTTSANDTSATNAGGEFEMTVNGNSTIVTTVKWKGVSVITNFSINTPILGHYCGLGVIAPGGSAVSIASFTVLYSGNDSGTFTFAMANSGRCFSGDTSLATVPYDTAIASGFANNTRVPHVSYLGRVYFVNSGGGYYYYDCASNSISNWNAAGLPSRCTAMCLWQGRIVIIDKGVWYMSRAGDPDDWDYGASDLDYGRAMEGTSASESNVGEDFVSVIPFTNDYLAFLCKSSTWVMVGNPADPSAAFYNRSREIGISGPDAYCMLPDGSAMLLSEDGVYVLSPGGVPESVSRHRMPTDLLGRWTVWGSGASSDVFMSYDTYAEGVHLFIRKNAGVGTSQYWFIHLPTLSYWPGSTSVFPTAIAQHHGLGHKSTVLLGGSDGYIRYFDEFASDDDGNSFTSLVFIGPLRPGGTVANGMITQMEAVLAESSGAVTWGIFVGDTAESAVSSGAKALGTWSAGRNTTNRPMVRGQSIFLRLTSTEQWQFEEVTAWVKPVGRVR